MDIQFDKDQVYCAECSTKLTMEVEESITYGKCCNGACDRLGKKLQIPDTFDCTEIQEVLLTRTIKDKDNNDVDLSLTEEVLECFIDKFGV